MNAKYILNIIYCCINLKLKTFTVWTDAIVSGIETLHADGITVEQISKSLSSIPFNPKTATLIKYLSSKGVTLMIASDANTFYIDEILRNFEIRQYFTRIYSNKGIIKDGKLIISRYVPADACHGCDQCPPNLCKVISIRNT